MSILIAATYFLIRWHRRRLDKIFDQPPPAGLGRSDSTRTDTVVMDKAMRAIYANELSPEDKLYAGQETLDQRSMRELEADQAVTPIDKPMPVLPLPSDNAGGRGRETMFRQVDGWLQRTTSMFSQPNRNTVFPRGDQNQ